MGIAGKAVGPRGLALLAVTAVAGIVLAVHGWSERHAVLAPGSLAGTGVASSPRARISPSARAGNSSSPAAPGPSATRPATTPGTTPTTTPGTTPAARPGPMLSSQSFAPYSYRVWPGAPSSAARAAATGLSISVHQRGSGISVTAGVNGQSPAAPHFYRLGARVYVVEASLGDDSGNSDYNLGDDGLVVTDAQGRIVR